MMLFRESSSFLSLISFAYINTVLLRESRAGYGTRGKYSRQFDVMVKYQGREVEMFQFEVGMT
jgi:hypothetical protein